MKKIKRTISLLLASVSVASAVSLASCDFFPDPQGPASSGNIHKIVGNLTDQQFKSISLDGTYEENWDYSDADWSSYDKANVALKGTVNLPSGDADIRWYSATDWTNYESREENEPAIENYYTLIYMRDWYSFMGGDWSNEPDAGEIFEHPEQAKYQSYLGNILDFSGLNDLFESEYGKYFVYAFELMGYDVLGASAQEVANTAFAFLNAEIISIADAADAVVEKDDKLIVDLNKTLHTFFSDLEEVVLSLKNSTTTKDLLKNATIKKYMEAIFRTAKAEDVVTKFLEVYTAFEKDFGDSFYLPIMQKISEVISIKPDKNSTAYEYLVKIATSKSFDELLQLMVGEDVFSMDTPILHYTSKNDIFSTLGLGYISSTEEEFCISVVDEFKFAAKNTKWTYTVKDNRLEGLEFGADVVYEQYYSGVEGTLEFDGTLDFSTEEAQLANVDEFEVIEFVPVFEDGTRVGYGYIYDDFAINGVFENNLLVDLKSANDEYVCTYDTETKTLQLKNNDNNVFEYTVEFDYDHYYLYCYLYDEYNNLCGYIDFAGDDYQMVKQTIKDYLEQF